LRASFVAPIDQPILRDAAIVCAAGHILEVGPDNTLIKSHPDARVHDFGNAVILPGLVNPHTHLELSGCTAGDSPGGSFADWIMSLPRRIGRETGKSPEELFGPATRRGIQQCLRFGVTTVGDISQQMHITRPIIRESPIRCVSFGEVIGLGGNRKRYDELLPRAIDRAHQTDRLRIGLSPHAPYTVDLDGFRQCLEMARQQDLPLATHLAETPAEREFLDHHSGPFQQIWQMLGHWREGLVTMRGSPICAAQEAGLLDYPTVLAHVNYCGDDELELLARGRASVIYCPRTHAYFGHPPHRWREMLSRGINVAVGTDSCASSPDLNIIDDLGLLQRQAPDLPAQQIWEMVTVRAARALGLDHMVGSLTPGKLADFAVFETSGDDPLRQALHDAREPLSLWIDGAMVRQS
jgi:cytosine/adenosine deaminase-related metal-dependent hydrolase